MDVSDVIRDKDERPQLNGWGPGDYYNKCVECDYLFVGDKRAITCAVCAYKDRDGEE